MAPRSTKITLDGKDYEVPTLSLDQLERIGTLFNDASTAKQAGAGSFALFKIVIEDIIPATPEGQKLRCSADEMRTALAAILKDAGLQAKPENPPVPAETPAAPAAA